MSVFLLWEKLSIVLLFSGICDQNLCFLFGRERLSISFHCCGICFYILSKKHSACILIWAGVRVLTTLAIKVQLLPYFSYSSINILCSSGIHLPLSIVLFGKLDGASFSIPKETGIENELQLWAIVMQGSQWNVLQTGMSNSEQITTNSQHQKEKH